MSSTHFSLYRFPDRLLISRSAEVSASPEALSIDCSTSSVSLDFLPKSETLPLAKEILGVLGIVRLAVDSYVVVLAESAFVCYFGDHLISRLVRVELVPLAHLDEVAGDEPYLRMIHQNFRSDNLYFSRTYDLTKNLQSTKSPNSQFLWNENILARFDKSFAEPFVVGLLSGCVANCELEINRTKLQYLLISRRSHLRVGMRYLCRGIDQNGNCANSVETEQIVVCRDEANKRFLVSSYCQIRGSIPVFWSQTPNLMYKPIPRLLALTHSPAFQQHFDKLRKNYGGGQVQVVDLIDQKGPERVLGNAYEDLCSKFGIPYIGFDFHAQSKRGGDSWIQFLMADLDSFIRGSEYYLLDFLTKQVIRRQRGIVRTNCVDSLDRTNVIQCEIAKRVLEDQLCDLGVCDRNSPLRLFPEALRTIMNVWADNADALSLEYSGTPALKTDFTRSGRRTFWGMLNDGRYSLERYLYGNFYDGFNQDSLALLHGTHQVALSDCTFESAVQRLSRNRLIVLPAVSLICLIMMFLNMLLTSVPSRDSLVNSLFWFAGFGASICATLMFGDDIVDRPRLTYGDHNDNQADLA